MWTKKQFFLSTAVILFFTGAAKIWSAFGDVKVLAVSDPILGLKFSHLLFCIGILELIIAGVCIFNNSLLATALTACLATNFLAYRTGLWLLNWHRPCPCLGYLTDPLHISPQTADTAMKIILAYLLIGSYATLFWLWRQRRLAPSALK